MTNKEIIKRLEDIEEVLNLSDKEFTENIVANKMNS